MLAACTQEEPSFPTGGVEGAYPLQISSVTLAVEAGEEPWTRISESQDGQSSAWDWNGTEQIAVQLAGETAVYTLNADQTLTSDKQLYWQSTAPATVTAWNPVEETVNLQDQSQRLAYVLQATVPDAPYGQPVSLAFTHQLAKVRVTLGGSRAGQVTQVEAYGPTSCTHSQGTVAPGSAQGWIKMHQVDAATWEANLAPGTVADPNQFIRLNGSAPVALTAPGQLTAGAMHTINVLVKAPLITGPGYTIDPDLHTITLSGAALTLNADKRGEVSGNTWNGVTWGSIAFQE